MLSLSPVGGTNGETIKYMFDRKKKMTTGKEALIPGSQPVYFFR